MAALELALLSRSSAGMPCHDGTAGKAWLGLKLGRHAAVELSH